MDSREEEWSDTEESDVDQLDFTDDDDDDESEESETEDSKQSDSEIVENELAEFNEEETLDTDLDARIVVENDDSFEHELKKDLFELISSVWKVVSTFKRSPKNQEILDKFVTKKFKQRLRLILNSKTRWSIMFAMLKRFQLIYSCVQRAIISLKKPAFLQNINIKSIKEVVKALYFHDSNWETIVKIQKNNQIDLRSKSLADADTMFRFAIQKLNVLKKSSSATSVARDLEANLLFRVDERRGI